jgi:hypothetical protein
MVLSATPAGVKIERDVKAVRGKRRKEIRTRNVQIRAEDFFEKSKRPARHPWSAIQARWTRGTWG